MEAKELRINNLVYWNGRLETIDLNSFGTQWNNSDGRLLFEEYKPIPLTEEWMHRLEGSEYSTIYLYKGGDRWFVSIQSSATDCDYYNPEKEIKYVHEWQNAYKFWEGEELTIKK